jgi:hypothetical protein
MNNKPKKVVDNKPKEDGKPVYDYYVATAHIIHKF